MTLHCKRCATTFERPPSQAKKSKNHFCSQSCAAEFNNIGVRRNPPKARVCRKCDTPFIRTKDHRSLKLCGKCVHLFENFDEALKNMPISRFRESVTSKHQHPSWKNAQIRTLNRKWNKDLTKAPCAVCGYSKHTELAHIKAISTFPPSALLKEVNARNNVVPLCPTHHWEFDNNQLDEPLKSRTGIEPVHEVSETSVQSH